MTHDCAFVMVDLLVQAFCNGLLRCLLFPASCCKRRVPLLTIDIYLGDFLFGLFLVLFLFLFYLLVIFFLLNL